LRPVVPVRPLLNRRHPLAGRIVACFVPDKAGMIDLASDLRLLPINSATTVPSPFGLATNCVGTTGTTSRGVRATAPGYLRLSFPLTLIWIGIPKGTPDNNSNLASINFGATDINPFVCWGMNITSSGNVQAIGNTAGSLFTLASTFNLNSNAGKLTVISTRFRSGAIQIRANGSVVATGTTALTTPNYSSSSPIEVGTYQGVMTRNANHWTLAVIAINGPLSDSWETSIHRNPGQLFTQATLFSVGKASAASWYRWGRLRDEQIMSGGING